MASSLFRIPDPNLPAWKTGSNKIVGFNNGSVEKNSSPEGISVLSQDRGSGNRYSII